MSLKPRPYTEAEWDALCDDESDGIANGFRDPRSGKQYDRTPYNPNLMKWKDPKLNVIPEKPEEFNMEVEVIEEIDPGVFHVHFWFIGDAGNPEHYDTRLSRQPVRVPPHWTGTDEEYIDDWMQRQVRFRSAANKRVRKEKARIHKKGTQKRAMKGRLKAKHGKPMKYKEHPTP